MVPPFWTRYLQVDWLHTGLDTVGICWNVFASYDYTVRRESLYSKEEVEDVGTQFQ